jgi:hypothetical protein
MEVCGTFGISIDFLPCGPIFAANFSMIICGFLPKLYMRIVFVIKAKTSNPTLCHLSPLSPKRKAEGALPPH